MYSVLARIVAGLLGLAVFSGAALILLRNESFSGNGFRKKINRSLAALAAKGDRENNLLYGTQYFLSRKVYNLARYAVSAFAGALALASLNFFACFVIALALLLTIPAEKTPKGRKLPFYYFAEAFRKAEREEKNQELLVAMSFLRNLIVQSRGNPLGADYIIEYLAESAKITKPAYQKLLNNLRLHRKDAAIAAFVAEIDTEIGKDVASLLVGIDAMDPRELREAISARQNHIREIRHTNNKKRDELVSDLIYLPIILTMILVLLNFIVVAYWIDAKEVFSFLQF